MQLRLKNIYIYMQKKEKSTECGIYHAPETRQVKTAFDLVEAYCWMISKKQHVGKSLVSYIVHLFLEFH